MSSTPDSDTTSEAAYVLAILRGAVPPAHVPVAAHQWPSIIEVLRAMGYEIRETANGYQLVGTGIDIDGTGYSAATTYRPVRPNTTHLQPGETTITAELPLRGGVDLHTSLNRTRAALEREPTSVLPTDPPQSAGSDHVDVL